jgi:alpha-beta hydrolase superfamily lysophospholipase
MGRSQGRRGHVRRWSQWIEDYAAFHAALVEQAPGVEVVPLGHSFGGVLLVTAILHGAVRPRRFVLSNPAFRSARPLPSGRVRLARLASRLLPALTQSNQVEPESISRDPALVAEYRDDPLVHDRISARLFTEWQAASEEAMARAAEIQVPFLLIVAAQDRLVDPQGAAEFSSRATADHAMRLYQGRYHEPFNDVGAEEVFADLAAWLEGRG